MVVPVKSLASAKSRLCAGPTPLPDGVRRRLALAFACDTVTAALACDLVRLVRVVTDDLDAAAALTALGAQAYADGGHGLNAAISAATASLQGRVAVLCGDLAALTPGTLELVLRDAAHADRAVLADRSGRGSTILTALSARQLVPHFGEASLQAHLACGHAPLPTSADRARLDIDTVDDLREAMPLGLGRHTMSVLHAVTFAQT